MNRNVEVKVRTGTHEELLARLIEMKAEDRGILRQVDTYFLNPREEGTRAKIREQEPGQDELIVYRRPDVAGHRTSQYLVQALVDAAGIREWLSKTLGVSKVIRKRRHLFLVGRTRVHLDEVDDLGTFLELEVVLQEDDDEAAGREEAEHILEQLGLASAERIAGSYSEM